MLSVAGRENKGLAAVGRDGWEQHSLHILPWCTGTMSTFYR